MLPGVLELIPAAKVSVVGIKRDEESLAAKPYYENLRSEEHTSELQSLMRISYAVFCLKTKTTYKTRLQHTYTINCYKLTLPLHHHQLPSIINTMIVTTNEIA